MLWQFVGQLLTYHEGNLHTPPEVMFNSPTCILRQLCLSRFTQALPQPHRRKHPEDIASRNVVTRPLSCVTYHRFSASPTVDDGLQTAGYIIPRHSLDLHLCL
jgi:hypothetical protein